MARRSQADVAEDRLKRLRNGFRAVSRPVGRSSPKRKWPQLSPRDMSACILMIGFVLIGVVNIYAAFAHHNWPISTTFKHIAAAPNCADAHRVGLAPSKRGEPGYYFRHDRYQDGIACEPWPRY